MLNEWSDKEPDPNDRIGWFGWLLGAVAILATAAGMAQGLLWLIT